MSFSSWLRNMGTNVEQGADGSIMPSGFSSVRAPTMGSAQRNQIEQLQSLLGKGAEQSVQGLLNQGQTPLDKRAISDFERNIMPQITQGAARNNLLGASGIAGAQADATSRLAEGLAAQKYSAIGDLLSKYGQFSQLSPYKYSAYQSPKVNWGDLAELLGGDRSDSGWGESIGELLGGGAGTMLGGIGTLAGAKLGKAGGRGVEWLLQKLFGNNQKAKLPNFNQEELNSFLTLPQY
jgi:hypothetical protein